VRVPYRSYPLDPPNPAFPHDDFLWHPVIPVSLTNASKHRTSKRFEAWIDSGSPYCYFNAAIGRAIGIVIESGIRGKLGGVVGGLNADVYFHSVGVYVGADLIRVKAGFCDQLAVPGVLGRTGFFDNFKVAFDQSGVPPCCEIERIVRH